MSKFTEESLNILHDLLTHGHELNLALTTIECLKNGDVNHTKYGKNLLQTVLLGSANLHYTKSVIEKLLISGIDINYKNTDECSSLQMALESNKVEIIIYLIKAGADITGDYDDDKVKTILFIDKIAKNKMVMQDEFVEKEIEILQNLQYFLNQGQKDEATAFVQHWPNFIGDELYKNIYKMAYNVIDNNDINHSDLINFIGENMAQPVEYDN